MFATGPKALPCQRTKPRTITILRCRTRGDESTIWPRRALQLCCGHRGRFPLGERHGNDAHAAKRFAGGERGAQCPRRGRACMHHPHGDARGLRQCQDAQFGRVRENARVSGSHRVRRVRPAGGATAHCRTDHVLPLALLGCSPFPLVTTGKDAPRRPGERSRILGPQPSEPSPWPYFYPGRLGPPSRQTSRRCRRCRRLHRTRQSMAGRR